MRAGKRPGSAFPEWPSPWAPQVKRLSILQPHVLKCCYSSCERIVEETFRTLGHLLEDLTWQHSSYFLIQLAFTLGPFLEEVTSPEGPVLLWAAVRGEAWAGFPRA